MSLAAKTVSHAGDELTQGMDPARLPRHIAIIMDGSGRWAERHHKPRVAGHVAGARAVRAVVETCARLGIPALTLYAFSAENWRRPLAEVNFLMLLLRRYLRSEVAELKRQNIRLEAIGRLQALPEAVREDLERSRAATAGCDGTQLTLALNYSARAEIVDACQALVDRAAAEGRVEVTEAELQQHLYTAHLPEPDLLIRTSGEQRVSNFLLWQIAYAELWVTPVLWPDFRGEDLLEAIRDFQRRERRFGGLSPTTPASGTAGKAGLGPAPRTAGGTGRGHGDPSPVPPASGRAGKAGLEPAPITAGGTGRGHGDPSPGPSASGTAGKAGLGPAPRTAGGTGRGHGDPSPGPPASGTAGKAGLGPAPIK